jgi:hypothetical protein
MKVTKIINSRAEFYGYYWYYMENLLGTSVDEYSMEAAWQDYQKDPRGWIDNRSDPYWTDTFKRLDR